MVKRQNIACGYRCVGRGRTELQGAKLISGSCSTENPVTSFAFVSRAVIIMAQEFDSAYTLRDESAMKSMNGPRNWQKRLPYFTPSETPLSISTRINTDLNLEGVKLEKAPTGKDRNEDEKENIPELSMTPEPVRKSRTFKEGSPAQCLLDKLNEGAESEPETSTSRCMTPPQTPPPRRVSGGPVRVGFATPPRSPKTPLQQTRTPQSKPPPAWSPAPRKKTYTPVKGTPPCTPPRKTPPRRLVHNPYRLPGTPPACKSPAFQRSPLVRASPKPRTPTRTRLAVQKQNAPRTPGLSTQPQLALSVTPQQRVATMQQVTPTSSTPGAASTPGATPGPTQPSPTELSTATQFLQYTAVTEHLPPSLQQNIQPHYTDQQTTPSYTTTATMEQLEMQLNLQFSQAPSSIAPNQCLPLQNATPQVPAQGIVDYSASCGVPTESYAPVMVPPPPQPLPESQPPMLLESQPNMQYNTNYRPVVEPQQNMQYNRNYGQVMESQPNMEYNRAYRNYPANNDAPQRASNTKIYALVEFKRGRTVQFQSAFSSRPGDYVLVEGDEGEDMGMVVHSWVAPSNSPPVVNNSLNSNKYDTKSAYDYLTGDPIYPKVIRHASEKEVQYLHNAQAQVEIKCAEVARHKVREHRLPMTIVDAEYQFDRKKLTFYYDSAERIDFRDLVKELYKLYRARIWMSKV